MSVLDHTISKIQFTLVGSITHKIVEIANSTDYGMHFDEISLNKMCPILNFNFGDFVKNVFRQKCSVKKDVGN